MNFLKQYNYTFNVAFIATTGFLLSQALFVVLSIMNTLIMMLFNSQLEILIGYPILALILLPMMLVLMGFILYSILRRIFNDLPPKQITIAFIIVLIIYFAFKRLAGQFGSFDLIYSTFKLIGFGISAFLVVLLHRKLSQRFYLNEANE